MKKQKAIPNLTHEECVIRDEFGSHFIETRVDNYKRHDEYNEDDF